LQRRIGRRLPATVSIAGRPLRVLRAGSQPGVRLSRTPSPSGP